ncbi:MAG: OmpA family protein [Saprospiraceae bacterium]
MSYSLFHPHRVLIISLFSLFAISLHSQKAGLEVTRCEAMDRSLEITNVSVDASGRRWAANKKGVFQIKANDFSVPLKIAAGYKNVLSYPGGNVDFAWLDDEFKKQVHTPCTVTAAWYDSKNKVLWLGTDEAGLFQFSTDPDFKMVQQYLPVNSKLQSSHITSIYQDNSGRFWIGNTVGIMYGTPGRWKSDLDGYPVQRIREYNNVIFVLADGYISKAPNGDKWSDLSLDEKKLEGDIRDFDIDATGKMWLLSGHLTRFDMLANTYDVFSGPEYYTSQYGSYLSVDNDGAVWVGTYDKGLYSVDKASNMVLNAYVDKPISCEGDGKDAQLMARVTGGVEPYTYSWSAGLSGENPKNIGAGTYSVTVTDSKGKTRSSEIMVLDSRLKLKVRQKKAASGPGMADGSAEVDIATNASGITVVWDNGESKVVATKLTSGEHKVTVTDPKGCAMTLTTVVKEQGQPLALEINVEAPIKCAGDKTGIVASASGGKIPYSFTWSLPELNGARQTLGSGPYSVTVTDGAGSSTTASFFLPQPEPVSINVVVQSSPSSGAADGKALVQAKGGSGVYSFKWDNGETNFTASKLAEGAHQVTATDGNGCSASAPFDMKAKLADLTVILREARPIKCAGEKTNLTVAAVGGKEPYKEFQWSPAIGSLAEGVKAGNYTVTATDALGSTATASININEPQKLVADAIAQSATSPGKDDGKALVSVKGGTGAMFFTWDNEESTAATNFLSAGLHKVTVTDENGCTATASVTITEGVLPLSMVIKKVKNVKCPGEKASLEVEITGGKGPFEYVWSDPKIIGGRPDVPAGEYTVTMTDRAGSTATASISVEGPAPFDLSTTATRGALPGSKDGASKIEFKGGTSPYSYVWDNGETTQEAVQLSEGEHSVTATDANGCAAVGKVSVHQKDLPLEVSLTEKPRTACSGEKASLIVEAKGGRGPINYAWSDPKLSGNNPNNLPGGNYTVTVSDNAGAIATASIQVNVSDALKLSASVVAAASTGKSDGQAKAEVSGGKSPYTYKWSSGESSETASALAPGNQGLTVTDANGCTASASLNISENILPLSAKIIASEQVKCSGDKISVGVDVSGGKKPFTYNWNNPAASGETASFVGGTYKVTVTDAVGTTVTASIDISQPEPLTVSAEVLASASAGNKDGKAIATPTGGTAPYIYAWSSGESTNQAERLGPGNHDVKVTDANGCHANAVITITENILPLAISIEELKSINCAGEKADLQVKVKGGKPPFQYEWNTPGLADANPAGIGDGNYSVTVTDALGTSKEASVSLSTPAELSLELQNVVGASSDKVNDGKAEIAVKGGTPEYSIRWDSRHTGLVASKLPIGKHSVTVTDAKGCKETADFEIKRRVFPELTGKLEDGQTIRMRLLKFAPDSTNLQPEAYFMLDELYDFMMEHSFVVIEVAGHTNNLPNDEFADQLSTARAKSVADYLFEKGIDPSRVVYKGYGKRLPLVPNTSPEGRATNQRVEIKLLKVKE